MTGELVRIQRDEALELRRELFGDGDGVGEEGRVSVLFERLTGGTAVTAPCRRNKRLNYH